MNSVVLITGTNIGDRMNNLKQAEIKISDVAGDIVLSSSYYETEPWGSNSFNWYLNQVLLIKTLLPAETLLSGLLRIEAEYGRKRTGARNEDRVLDIDILFYDNFIYTLNHLVIPHPRLHLRRFTLVPLNEIIPDFIHPVFGESLMELLNKCPDKQIVNKYRA